MSTPSGEVLAKVYGSDKERASERFSYISDMFEKTFGEGDPEFFTAPGRTEIIGNHTDHNGGKVIAGCITLDSIGAAKKNGTRFMKVSNEGYGYFEIDLDHPENSPKEHGTVSVLAGIIEYCNKNNIIVDGFSTYTTTEVIGAAGVSSSASFEMLIMAMINFLFNDGNMSFASYAKAGQYAENIYWNKASGLMDQMACAVGGPIELDFRNDPVYEKIPFGFEEYGYSMVIVNTGKGHADLSPDYSAVPSEMRAVAKALGHERLCDGSLEELLDNYTEVKEKVQNDRAVLRAIHFYTENDRVIQMSEAMEKKDVKAILNILNKGGESSYEQLQNPYSLGDVKTQGMCLALSLTKLFMARINDGACRIHGGGFAGVIQSVVPTDKLDDYVGYISGFFGRDNVYPMNIRATGAAHLDK